jgi:predicted N-acyltransferase
MKNKLSLIEGKKILSNNYDHKHRKPSNKTIGSKDLGISEEEWAVKVYDYYWEAFSEKGKQIYPKIQRNIPHTQRLR